MPIHHGLNSTSSVPLEFRFDCKRLASDLAHGETLADKDQKEIAQQVDAHLGHAVTRLLFSIQELNMTAQRVVRRLQRSGDLIGSSSDLEILGSMADHVFGYLGMTVDDLAEVISLSMKMESLNGDGMGKLKSIAKKDAQFSKVANLLSSLDQSGSWWDIGFKRFSGVRQRLVHHRSIIQFQVSKAPRKRPEIWGFFIEANPDYSPSNQFFPILRAMFLHFFDWLDQLHAILRAQIKAPPLSMAPPTWSFLFPIALRMGTTRFAQEYFPLPMLDQSNPLPAGIRLEFRKAQ